MAKILVVDDEESICYAFEKTIKLLGHTPCVASNAVDAMVMIKNENPSIVFLDYRLPGENGLELLEKIKAANPDIAIVIMTAYGTMDTAIDAVKKGAYEYLAKPVDFNEIKKIIDQVLKPMNAESFSSIPENGEFEKLESDTIIGSTDAISDIYKMIGLLTTNDVPVLIEGESGVGKELVARAIHNKSSRKDFPFVAINCGAMPENLLESELFGHEKGSFTGADTTKIGKFEYAKNGTIFLDEIGDLKLSLQVKLLRVLQNKQIVRVGGLETISVGSTRIITATNKNLLQEMKSGKFRSDLYYRLQLITLKIPPLRERKEDISELVSHFIQKANNEIGLKIKSIEKEALKELINYDWPGNVRELENVIKRAALLSRVDTIGSHNIELTEKNTSEKVAKDGTVPVISDQVEKWFDKRDALFDHTDHLFSDMISQVEKVLISKALEICRNNQLKTSELLGMNRSTLRNKIKEYHL